MGNLQALAYLGSSLSEGASIHTCADEGYAISAARWSDLNTPKPGAVVNVATESDVEATVQWATKHGIPFVAQSGGHAWSSWFKISSGGIVINMRKLNTVEIDLEKGEGVIGGGTLVKELVTACKEKRAHVVTGTCNTVGAIPSMVGGGLGYLMGLYGCGADNIISLRLVGADGQARTVSADSNPDLFWAVRGAAHNFGIVTSVTSKAYPELNGGMHYMALLAWSPEQLEQVVAAVTEMGDFGPDMMASLLFLRAPPDFAREIVAISLWHPGGEEAAKQRFASLFNLNPMVVQAGLVPFDHLNDGIDHLCVKGGNKFVFSTSVNKITPAAMRQVWEKFTAFTSLPDSGPKVSVVNVELYSTKRTTDVPLNASAVGPGVRTKRYHAFIAAIYSDPNLHEAARGLGDFRKILNDVEGEKATLYPNFATGDETVESLYGEGERLEKLRGLKKQYDPTGMFNHYLPIV